MCGVFFVWAHRGRRRGQRAQLSGPQSHLARLGTGRQVLILTEEVTSEVLKTNRPARRAGPHRWFALVPPATRTLRTGAGGNMAKLALGFGGGSVGATFAVGAWYINKSKKGARLRNGAPDMDAEEGGEVPIGTRVRVDFVVELEGHKMRSHIVEPAQLEVL